MKILEELEKLAKDSIFSEEGQVGFVVGYSRCLKDSVDIRFTDDDIRTAFFQGFVVKSTLQKNESIDDAFNDFLKLLKNSKDV